jgi:hypothetical protein
LTDWGNAIASIFTTNNSSSAEGTEGVEIGQGGRRRTATADNADLASVHVAGPVVEAGKAPKRGRAMTASSTASGKAAYPSPAEGNSSSANASGSAPPKPFALFRRFPIGSGTAKHPGNTADSYGLMSLPLFRRTKTKSLPPALSKSRVLSTSLEEFLDAAVQDAMETVQETLSNTMKKQMDARYSNRNLISGSVGATGPTSANEGNSASVPESPALSSKLFSLAAVPQLSLAPHNNAISQGRALSSIVAHALQSVPLFKSMSTSERWSLLSHMTVARYCEMDIIFSTSAVQDALVVLVIDGSIAFIEPVTDTAKLASNELLPELGPGGFFLPEELGSETAVIARIPTSCLVLTTAQLNQSLAWFSFARRLKRTGKSSAPSDPAFLALSLQGLPRADGERVVAAMKEAIGKAAHRSHYMNALRQFKGRLNRINIPAPRVQRTMAARLHEVEQASKDFLREHAVLLNGVSYPLGTPQKFQRFLRHLAGVIRDEVCADPEFVARIGACAHVAVDHNSEKHGLDHPQSNASAEVHSLRTRKSRFGQSPGARTPDSVREDIVQFVVSEVLIAAARTATGGESFAQTHSLSQHPLVFLAAESGAQSPADIIVQERTISIGSTNSFKICHMRTEDEDAAMSRGNELREREKDREKDPAAILRAGVRGLFSKLADKRKRADTANAAVVTLASNLISAQEAQDDAASSGMQVWALIRCAIRETFTISADCTGDAKMRSCEKPETEDSTETIDYSAADFQSQMATSGDRICKCVGMDAAKSIDLLWDIYGS